jgi:hypothetical protein
MITRHLLRTKNGKRHGAAFGRGGFGPFARACAFILFEALLAVAIFALGVLALGRCVEACVRAETLKEEYARARRALENRMVEIEAGAVPLTDKAATEELKGMFAGLTLKQSRQPLKRKNEKDQEITGIYVVSLEVGWTSQNEPQSQALQFYVSPKQR